MKLPSPFAERSLTVVAASFPDRAHAEAAAAELAAEAPDLQGEIAVIPPGDPLACRKLEPENTGIWHTALRSHLLFGALGALVGLVVAIGYISSWDAAAASPGYATLFTVVFFTFFGMLFAGLLTLRPDHGFVIRQVLDASRQGLWSVVVRPLDHLRTKFACDRLQRMGAPAVRSL